MRPSGGTLALYSAPPFAGSPPPAAPRLCPPQAQPIAARRRSRSSSTRSRPSRRASPILAAASLPVVLANVGFSQLGEALGLEQSDRLTQRRRQRSSLVRVELCEQLRVVRHRARRRPGTPLLVSIISCWEVAVLAERGKLRFSIPAAKWLEQATSLPGFDVAPITLPVITNAVRLTALRDPADQIVVATALDRGARLITSDAKIGASRLVPVVA